MVASNMKYLLKYRQQGSSAMMVRAVFVWLICWLCNGVERWSVEGFLFSNGRSNGRLVAESENFWGFPV